ncbi:MAG: hypothetical protein ACLUE2_11460 [Bacteroides cellulosilyticus]
MIALTEDKLECLGIRGCDTVLSIFVSRLPPAGGGFSKGEIMPLSTVRLTTGDDAESRPSQSKNYSAAPCLNTLKN